jgi:hypothetical protein
MGTSKGLQPYQFAPQKGKQMILVDEAILLLQSLSRLVLQLDGEAYARPVRSLGGTRISEHIRHILEFYQEFLLGKERGDIDFDSRERSQRLESDSEYASGFIATLIEDLESVGEDQETTIQVSTHQIDQRIQLKSTLYRELAYCNEHSVHHMAMIKIGIVSEFPGVELSSGFGVAFSTQHAKGIKVTC